MAMHHVEREPIDFLERPKHPHQFALNSHICWSCGLSRLAVAEFPQLRECTPPIAAADG
jgi:hypothetical protein